MTQIVSSNIVFFDSDSPPDLLIDICRDAENDSLPGSKNLSIDGWEKNPASLLYKLYIEKIYDKSNRGRFLGYLEDGKLQIIFGASAWDKDPNACIMPSRLYLRKDKRGEGTGGTTVKYNYLWDVVMKEECIDLGYKAALITHNKYNLWIREKTIERLSKFDFIPVVPYNDPVLINYTKQWVMYHLYDQSYEKDLIKSLDANKFG